MSVGVLEHPHHHPSSPAVGPTGTCSGVAEPLAVVAREAMLEVLALLASVLTAVSSRESALMKWGCSRTWRVGGVSRAGRGRVGTGTPHPRPWGLPAPAGSGARWSGGQRGPGAAGVPRSARRGQAVPRAGPAGGWAGAAPYPQAAQLSMEQRRALPDSPAPPAHPRHPPPHRTASPPPPARDPPPQAPSQRALSTPRTPTSSPEKPCWFW